MSDKPERIDVNEFKRQHDLRAVVERTTGSRTTRGNLYCPFHAHNYDTPSLHVYDNGTWYCFSCAKTGDVIDWLGYLLYGEAYNKSEHFKDVIDSVASLNITPAKPSEVKRPLQTSQIDQSLAERFTGRLKPADLDYWEGLYIPQAILERFKIGKVGSSDYRDPNGELWIPANYWTIPYFYRGVLTGFKLRRDDRVIPNAQKYTSRGKKIAPYNIDALLTNPPVRVLINEDENSVRAQAALGLVGISVPANQWRAEWNSLLLGVSELIIVANNESADKPGLASALGIQQSLGRGRVILPDIGKDFDDYHRALWAALGTYKDVKATVLKWLEN